MEPSSAQPSEQPESPAGSPSEAGAASPPERGNWLQSALRAVSGRGEPRTDAPRAADEQAEHARSAAEEWTPPRWQDKSEYEQWLSRQQQSYADRRDRDRDRRAAAEQERERDQRIAGLEAEKSEARKADDIWRVGELQTEIDALKAGVEQEQLQTGALAEFVGTLRAEYDGALLDPLLKDLPTAVATKLVDDASVKGPDGKPVMAADGYPVGVVTTEARAALVAAAVKAIKDQARAEGRAEARKDPVLRKELMAAFKASPEAAEQEPVVLSEAPSGSGPKDMNDFIRSVRGSRNGR